MGIKTVLLQDASATTQPASPTGCGRNHAVLTMGYAGTAVGA